MCNRFNLVNPKKAIERFDITKVLEDFESRYNIAPRDTVAAVVENREGERELRAMQWSLVPFWSKVRKPEKAMTNARDDNLLHSKAFLPLLQRHRCLIPATGFYEWTKTEKPPQPYHFHFADNRMFAFAGIWDRWSGDDGEPLLSCALVTTSPNDVVAPFHDRMPVILLPEHEAIWLDRGTEEEERVRDLIRPHQFDDFVVNPVSKALNRVGTEGAELIGPLNSA